MKTPEYLPLAALLHDIGKFRMRHTQPNKPHQEHSYEFVTADFAAFFQGGGDTFRDAIRHHHPERYPECPPAQLQHLIEKQVILADRLSDTETADEEREHEYSGYSALVSLFSRLKDVDQEYHYPLTALNTQRDSVIPSRETPGVTSEEYSVLWAAFTTDLRRAAGELPYTSEFYQTLVALLHKYTARIPSSTPKAQDDKRKVPDISLYDHLRTTAALAACIGRELSEAEVLIQLDSPKKTVRKICTLIKGDLSGIQGFLYPILADGAAPELCGRSFYLQLLTEAIAKWILRQLDLPITNLLLASGGHFYILAPYSAAKERLDLLCQRISEKLWALHRGALACVVASISMTADDFAPDTFAERWQRVSDRLDHSKQVKWSEIGPQGMFDSLFEPHAARKVAWEFHDLGKNLRSAEHLVIFEVPEAPVPEVIDWHTAVKTFGLDVHVCKDTDNTPPVPAGAERAIVYRLKDTDFLTDAVLVHFQWEELPVSYDFWMLPQVIAHNTDGPAADYDALADAAEGAQWLGTLRMDVDDLGILFAEKLGWATLSRVATLSEHLRLFFEGYVPQLCREYNGQQKQQVLDLVYAGGDDLCLIGGWSALPEIAGHIRSCFREFVTGDHVTLSGGIAIEHKRFPLYQLVAHSSEAEEAAKNHEQKDTLTFLRKPVKWGDFAEVHNWHKRFLEAVDAGKDALPSLFLIQLDQIYADKERWAWHSLYYFHRLRERYITQRQFLDELRSGLNHTTSFPLRDFIDVITRWTALRIKNKEA